MRSSNSARRQSTSWQPERHQVVRAWQQTGRRHFILQRVRWRRTGMKHMQRGGLKQMLDQLLSSGRGWLDGGGDTRKAQMRGDGGRNKLAAGPWRCCSNKKMRKLRHQGGGGGRHAAALGGPGLQLYRDWQACSPPPLNHPSPRHPAGQCAGCPRRPPGARQRWRRRRADGHIDAAERQKIQAYLTEQGKRDVARWIDAELGRPPSIPTSWRGR